MTLLVLPAIWYEDNDIGVKKGVNLAKEGYPHDSPQGHFETSNKPFFGVLTLYFLVF